MRGFPDFGTKVIAQKVYWSKRWLNLMRSPLPLLPPMKVFKPKHNLPVLKDYKNPASVDYWLTFPKNYVRPAISLVNGLLLKDLALQLGYKDRPTLEKAVNDLVHGADIGCRGRYRQPGRSSNAPSATANGARVSDAVADWVHKGFAYGPVPLCEVPREAKFNGIMTKDKPNGAVRVILNLSSPKGSAVNEGINNEEFPATMSSTNKWVTALWKAGKNCRMCKVDFSDAYKHIAVREADCNLQWFQWLGMGFQELCLIFGGVSSAGIFDRTAKLILFCVIARSGIHRDLVCQHLDDCCATAPASSSILEKYDAEFATVAKLLGVKLAPRDDPEKSFGPSTKGTILGVYYDTIAWTWAVPQDKLIRIVLDIENLLAADWMVQQEKIWSVVGKIINVAALVPGGRFNLYHLILANGISLEGKAWIPISKDLKRQLWFWQTMLPVCSGVSSIPRVGDSLPPWALDIYTDAAGGSWQTKLLGVGAVCGSWWVYQPWGNAINKGKPTGDGRKLDRVMSALELVGPLLGLCAGNKFCRNNAVRFWVDNSGSCFIWAKGYSSSCPLSSALVCAISCVAAGLGCRIEIKKITRCSTPLADMADALSKAAFGRFWSIASTATPNLMLEPLLIPRALKDWVENPTPDFDLGRKILKELSLSGPVLNF